MIRCALQCDPTPLRWSTNNGHFLKEFYNVNIYLNSAGQRYLNIRMTSLAVVKHFYVIDDVSSGLFSGCINRVKHRPFF